VDSTATDTRIGAAGRKLRLEDDQRAAAQATGVHQLLSLSGLLGFELPRDAQLQAPLGGQFPQLLEPIGALQHAEHPHLVDHDSALSPAAVPASHYRDRAAIGQCCEAAAAQQRSVEQGTGARGSTPRAKPRRVAHAGEVAWGSAASGT